MASIARPTLLRQTCIAATSKRLFSKTPARFPSAAARPTSSLLSKQPIRNAFVRDNIGSTRVAAFHASGRQGILPPGPQTIEGTLNDPAPVPHPSPSHGSYHWTFERLIAVGMIPLTVAPFAAGSLNPATDAILCATVLIHSHIGFESCVIDYFPVKEYPGLRMFFWWGLRAATLVVAVGLYEFETNDVGLTEAIKRVWTA